MDKIKHRDIKSNLGLWSYAKALGKVTYAMSKDVVKKIKTNYHKQKSKLKDYVKKDALSKVSSIEKELTKDIKNLKSLQNEMFKDKEYTHGSKTQYLAAVGNKIANLQAKKVKLKNKGLGIFALGKLGIVKIKKDYIEKRKTKKEIEKLKELEKKLEEERKVLEDLKHETLRLEEVVNDLKNGNLDKQNDEYKIDDQKPKKEEKIRLLNKKRSTMRERWLKAFAIGGMVAILANAILTCQSKLYPKYEKDFTYKPPEKEQVVDKNKEPDIIIIDKDYEKEDETPTITPSDKDIGLGSIVNIDTDTPIYISAENAIFNVSPVEHYFKDNDDRVVEAITYKYLENDSPKFITIFATEKDSDLKVELLKEKGATIESALITKVELSGKGLNHEGYKNINDVFLKEDIKEIRR